MRTILTNDIRFGNKSEELPDYTEEFPYQGSRMVFEVYEGDFVPWHWHYALELFYIEKGNVEYSTPQGVVVFEEGTAGIVNANVMHSTRPVNADESNIQLLHLFDPGLIGDRNMGRIYNKYIAPVVTNSGCEILKFDPKDPLQKQIVDVVIASFRIDSNAVGYEFILREMLSKFWIQMIGTIDFDQFETNISQNVESNLKMMVAYVHENFAEKISVSDIAAAGFISERGCYRVFNDYLHTTPSAYLSQTRIRKAIHMLTEKNYSISDIAIRCGFGDSSHFGRLFKKETGYSPIQYRKNWQSENR